MTTTFVQAADSKLQQTHLVPLSFDGTETMVGVERELISLVRSSMPPFSTFATKQVDDPTSRPITDGVILSVKSFSECYVLNLCFGNKFSLRVRGRSYVLRMQWLEEQNREKCKPV